MSVKYEKIVEEDLNLGVSTATVTMPSGSTATGTQINLQTFALSASKTWDPGSLANGAQTSTTVTVTGAVAGDMVLASLTTLDGTYKLILSAYVSAADTVTVLLANSSGGTLDCPSGTLKVLVFQCA